MSIDIAKYKRPQKLFVDEKSFNDFYHEHKALVYKTAFNITSCAESAHDIRQDVFLQLWVKRDLIDPIQNIKGYVYKFTRYRALHVLLENKSFKTYYEGSAIKEQSQIFEPMQKIEARLLCEKVRKTAAKRLPTECKKVFRLAIEKDMYYLDIAKELQVTPSTVKNQKVRAIRLIKEILGNDSDYASKN